MIKFITVATHSDFYFPVLKESCLKNNIELIVLGFGEKWKGFTWRFDLLRKYISKLDPDEIIIVGDAFDVIILNTNDIINKFLSLGIDNDSYILFSVEYVDSYIASLIN